MHVNVEKQRWIALYYAKRAKLLCCKNIALDYAIEKKHNPASIDEQLETENIEKYTVATEMFNICVDP